MNATCANCQYGTPGPNAGDAARIICHHASARDQDEPLRWDDWWCSEHPLRQRDRLAAMAMQGLLPFGGGNGPDWIANRAYEIADAMLAAASPPSRADNGRGRTRSPTPPAPSAKEDGK